MTHPTCPRCGRQHVTHHGHPACAGHLSKRDEAGQLQPCSKAPVQGATNCATHGASAPQVKAAAGRRVVEQQAANLAATLGLPVDVSPTEALLEEVRWTAGHVQWLRRKVAELDAGETVAGYGADDAATRHPLVWGTTRRVEKQATENPGTDTTESAEPSIWYELYAKERAHLVAVASAAIKAGVEERRVRLAEQQGDLVAEVIRRILDALNLSAEQQALVPTVVPRELRVIAGGGA
jgi:hypothetical protein